MMMSFFVFWLAAISLLGTQFMRGAHIINGENVWQFVDFQIIGGVATAIAGASMLSGALILHQFKPVSQSLKRPMQ